MVVRLKLDDRLSVLRAEDRFGKCRSLNDERFCIICKRTFNGRQVEIRRLGNRKINCAVRQKAATRGHIYGSTRQCIGFSRD